MIRQGHFYTPEQIFELVYFSKLKYIDIEKLLKNVRSKMSALEKMLQNVSGCYYNKINKACQPLLDHFGISNFSYHKLKQTGEYYCLGNNVRWLEHYFSEKYYLNQPHFRHPRNFQSSVCLSKHILNDEYQNFFQIASEKFNVHFGVVLINKVYDGLEIIGLDANTSSKMHDILILNELPLIREFIKKFVDENQFLIRLLEENQVNMGALIGPKFQNADISVTANLTRRKQFLKELGIEIPTSLSIRDKEVLKQLLNGNSAAQISKNLFLSCRTIEHYIERIKNKLVCFSKYELIKKARELEHFGYFEL